MPGTSSSGVALPVAQHHNSSSMHHVMNHSSSLNDLTSAKSRVRHEGSVYQKRAMEGSMRDILSQLPPPPPRLRKGQTSSVFPSVVSKKTAPSRNFAQENIKRIRQVAAERKEKEDMLNKTTAFRALWGTSKQREDTAPVVKRGQGQIYENGSRSRSQQGRCKSFQDGLNQISVDDEEDVFEKPVDSLTRRKSLVRAINLSTKPSKDFINLNKTVNFSAESRERRSSSASVSRRRSSIVDLDEVPKAKIGVVPDYILSEKPPVPKKAEKYNGNELPLGYRVMGKSERTRITGGLEHARSKHERELFLLPLRTDTMRAQRKRDELQAALKEIDDGLHMLTRATVIVNGNNVPGVKHILPTEPVSEGTKQEQSSKTNGEGKGRTSVFVKKDLKPTIKKTMRKY